MCQKALDLERGSGGERSESECRKDKDHGLWYRAGSPAEFRRVPMCCLSHWVHKKCSGLKGLTEDPDYRCIRCRGTARPLEGRPQRGPSQACQAGGGSFLLLPRRHALSSRWL